MQRRNGGKKVSRKISYYSEKKKKVNRAINK